MTNKQNFTTISTREILEYLFKVSFNLTERIKSIKTQHNYPSPIRKCVSFIDKNLHSKITLNELSQISGLSKDYLSQLFKKTTGTTITDYIMNKRLSSAMQLLDRDVSISDTAYALGFCSESYFIACFKKKYNITPKEYIKSKGKFKR